MRSTSRGRLVTTAVVALLGLAGVAGVAHRLSVPSDGGRLLHSPAHPLAVVVPSESRGLRTGDRVLAIDGIDLTTVRRTPFDEGKPTLLDRPSARYTLLRDGAVVEVVIERGPYRMADAIAGEWGNWLFTLVVAILGAIVFARRPDDEAARWLAVTGAAMAGTNAWFTAGPETADLLAGPGLLVALAGSIASAAIWPTLLGFAVAFARPRRLGAVLRWAVAGSSVVALSAAPIVAATGAIRNLPVVEWMPAAAAAGDALLAMPALVLVPVAFVLGYRGSGDVDHRRRVALVGAAFGAVTVGALLLFYLPESVIGVPLIPWNASGILALPIPIAIAWAILRHGAFDLRLAVNRSLAYGGLTLAIVAVYAAALGAAGLVLREQAGGLSALLATGVVAALVQPLRDALQRAANQLTYGDRDDPYAALSRLGRRLESSLSPDELLGAVCESVAAALRLPVVAIELDPGGGIVAEHVRRPGVDGHAPEPSEPIPLVHAGVRVGRLVLGVREPPLDARERRLLDDLVRQAAAAVAAVRLNRELQRSRELLVVAREDERRRIRNELHERLGQSLAAIGVSLEALRSRVVDDPRAAAARLVELRATADEALHDLRHVAAAIAANGVDPGTGPSRSPAPPAGVSPVSTAGPGLSSGDDRARPRQAGAGWPRSSRLVLALGVAMLVVSGVHAAYRLTLPSDGWGLAAEAIGVTGPSRLVIERAFLSHPASGLRGGDEILAIDGQPAAGLFGEAVAGRLAPLAAGRHTYTIERDGVVTDVDVDVRARPPLELGPAVIAWFLYSPALGAFLALASFVLWRRPSAPGTTQLFVFATGFAAGGLAEAIGGVSPRVADLFDPVAFWGHAWFANLQWAFLIGPTWAHLFLAFPASARVLARHRGAVLGVIYGVSPVVAGAGLALIRPPATEVWQVVTGVTTLTMLGLIALLLVRLGWLIARSRDPVARAQVRWVAWGSTVVFGLSLVSGIAWLTGVVTSAQMFDLARWYILALPASIAIAIVRHRLFDIDVVLSRTLVYGGLSALVVGVYGATVWASGELAASLSRDPTAVATSSSVLAATLVAVLVQPVRERLQRSVNRLVYGERDDPYGAMSRLAERIDAAVDPEAALPAALEAITGALRLPYAAIELDQAGRGTVVSVGRQVGEALRIPLAFHGVVVGTLVLAPRPGETLSAGERGLVGDLARQVGVAVHAARLRLDLRTATDRLAAAIDEERRRLRRDLHDGLGPALSGIALQIDAATRAVEVDPTAAARFVASAREATSAAVAEIRRIVYDLRPPALDELGLAGAIRRYAETLGSADAATIESTPAAATAPIIVVEAPERLPPLPAAVEVAALRIALEAVTNVVRHAGARRCIVRLDVAGELRLEVLDDGRGAAGPTGHGLGLASMRDRAAELGGSCRVEPAPSGGTRVLATLPIPRATETAA